MNTKTIAGTAIFMALTIVFTLISNFLQVGPVSINLSLVPIALAGILFGPVSGLLVGLVNGGFVMLATSTAEFFAINVLGTIIVCLLKSSIAGLASGLIFKAMKKKNELVGSIISSLIVPLLNTSIFIILAMLFFSKGFGTLISIFISVNFAIEFASTIILCPFIYRLYKYYENKNRV